MGRSFMKFKKPIPKNSPPVDFVELDKHLDDCSFIVSRFMKNVKFLLKRRKSNFNKMITYYRGFGIRISKSYLSELNSGKTRTCNLLILKLQYTHNQTTFIQIQPHTHYLLIPKS